MKRLLNLEAGKRSSTGLWRKGKEVAQDDGEEKGEQKEGQIPMCA